MEKAEQGLHAFSRAAETGLFVPRTGSASSAGPTSCAFTGRYAGARLTEAEFGDRGELEATNFRVGNTAGQRRDDLMEKVKHVAPESASSWVQHVAASVQRRSALSLAGAIAVGFLLGWLLGHRQGTS